MKRKKGFTLVELVIVIGLLLIFMGLFSFNAIKANNRSRENEKRDMIDQLESAADVYVSIYPSYLDRLYDDYGYMDITVKSLKDAGLIKKDLIDPDTGELVPNENIVRAQVGSEGELTFKYNPGDYIEGWNLIVHDAVISLNSSWDPLSDIKTGIILKNLETGEVATDVYYNTVSVVYSNVNFNKEGTYIVTYQFTDPSMGITKKKDRTVIVEAPMISYKIYHYIMKPDGSYDDPIIYNKQERYMTSITPQVMNMGNGFEDISPVTIVLGRDNPVVEYRYKRKKYTISINPNGGIYNGSGGITTKEIRYGAAYGLLNPTRENYVLKGWYTEATGGTKIDTSSMLSTDNHTIYAQWDRAKYTIKFNPNGGTLNNTTLVIDAGNKYGELPVPTKTDYVFMGWYTSTSGGTKVSENDVPTGSITLYAIWGKEYNITSKTWGDVGEQYTGACYYVKQYLYADQFTYNGIEGCILDKQKTKMWYIENEANSNRRYLYAGLPFDMNKSTYYSSKGYSQNKKETSLKNDFRWDNVDYQNIYAYYGTHWAYIDYGVTRYIVACDTHITCPE